MIHSWAGKAMLDVHAPYEALQTWKGFFIHIATICIGLLIAIALEQSVETIHRHRELAALRDEGRPRRTCTPT
jgi:hypothetical protein